MNSDLSDIMVQSLKPSSGIWMPLLCGCHLAALRWPTSPMGSVGKTLIAPSRAQSACRRNAINITVACSIGAAAVVAVAAHEAASAVRYVIGRARRRAPGHVWRAARAPNRAGHCQVPLPREWRYDEDGREGEPRGGPRRGLRRGGAARSGPPRPPVETS